MVGSGAVKNAFRAFRAVLDNALSHGAIWQMLNDKILPATTGDMVSDAYVMEVWDDFFIYEKGGTSYYQKYTVEDNEVTLVGVRQTAERVTQYRLADGSLVGNAVQGDGIEREDGMNKEQIVNALIANAESPWTEDDREALMKLSVEKLTHITGNAAPEKPEDKGEPATPPAAPAAPAPAPAAQPPVENVEPTVEEYIAKAPAGMRDMLSAGLAAHNAEKAKLVSAITANKRNVFTAEQLNAKGLGELKALATLAQETPAANAQPAQPTFVGMGEPAPVSNQGVVPLVAPTLNWGKDE